jgi:tetratricopeptide (TPR) repeat protein
MPELGTSGIAHYNEDSASRALQRLFKNYKGSIITLLCRSLKRTSTILRFPALHLRPDLPEVHLTFADHLYMMHRDYERAAVRIAIAERDLPNSPWALIIKSAIDRRRGRWDASTKGLEEAARLDRRNPAAINQLQFNYSFLRRFREWEQICDRLIQLTPGKPIFKANAASAAFAKTADVTKYRAVLETLRPALEHDIEFTSLRLLAAPCWMSCNACLTLVHRISRIFSYFYPNALTNGCQLYATQILPSPCYHSPDRCHRCKQQ